MDYEKLAYEFEFLRDRLKKIASNMCCGSQADLTEAAFNIGCLHSICHQHCVDFHKKHKEVNNVAPKTP